MKIEIDVSREEAELLCEMLRKILEDGDDYLRSTDHEKGCPWYDNYELPVTDCTCEAHEWLVEEQKALEKLFEPLERATS